MADIFDEVDEEVRRERMTAAAKKYGPLVGGGVALILAVVGGLTFWTQYQETQRQDAGAAFLSAARAQQQNPIAGRETFANLAVEGPEGYVFLARFKEAEALAADGDRKAAVAALNAVEEADAPARYKDLARLLALGLRSYDESAATLLPLLEPLMADGAPWRAFAIEQAAMLEIKLGKLNEARARLSTLAADATAPNGVRARAEAALTALPEG